MRRTIQICLLAGITCGALVALFVFIGNEKITNYPPKNQTIVAFGDSLVAGRGSTEGNDFVSVLEKKLGREIINLGTRGNTTADGLLRAHEVLDADPGIVLLLLGGNDFLRRVPTETTRQNLASLIETFIDNGSVVILLGVRGNILSDSRESMYRELSKTYEILYVEDVLDGIFMQPDYMFDGIHPNDIGYGMIADRLYEVFIDAKL